MMKIRLNTRQVRFLKVPFIFCAVIATTAQAQTLDKLIIYVWDFGTRNGEKNELTANLTNEFEEVLIQSKRCVVLERRNYDRLLAQKDNERAILKIEGISPTTLNNLKAHQANTVVFGEVYDDVESGQIKVTVVFQKFDGVKLTQQSILFSRGKRLDAESRKNAMQELARQIYGREEPIKNNPSSTEKPHFTQNTRWFKASVTKVLVNSGNQVVMFFEYFSNTREDYQIFLSGLSTDWRNETYVVDNLGNIFKATTVSGIMYGCGYYTTAFSNCVNRNSHNVQTNQVYRLAKPC